MLGNYMNMFGSLFSQVQFKALAAPEIFGTIGVAVSSAAFFLCMKAQIVNEIKEYCKSAEKAQLTEERGTNARGENVATADAIVLDAEKKEGKEEIQMKSKETLSIDQLLHKIVNMPHHDKSSEAEKSSKSALFSEEDELKITFDVHQAAMMSYDEEHAERCISLLLACPQAVNNRRYPYGFTPFLSACWTGNLTLVRFMLQNGANLKLCTEDGDLPFYLAVRSVLDKNHDNPSLELLEILLNAGSSVDCANHGGFTPLHLATACNNKLIVCWLLEHGASLSLRTSTGHRALDIARAQGYQGLVLLFLAAREDRKSQQKCAPKKRKSGLEMCGNLSTEVNQKKIRCVSFEDEE